MYTVYTNSMQQRTIVISALVAVLVVSGLGYLWSRQQSSSETGGMTVESMPAAESIEAAEDGMMTDPDSVDTGTDAEAISRLMQEIEAAAGGDEGALEAEYAAESESFMEGAVVMEQLGTSYDETSY